MDREADVDHMPPSMFNTLSPGQSSPRLEASPLVFTISPLPHPPSPPLCALPTSPFSPRTLTFYHHNRYIIPRSVFYSRVTPWNAFVRDIVAPRLSLSLLLRHPHLSILFVFFFRRLSDRRDRFFSFSVYFFIRNYAAGIARDYCSGLDQAMQGVRVIAQDFIDSHFGRIINL